MNKFEYKNLTPFKWFVLENFPFIEADFDALTEWQLFCKLGKEINKIINSTNTLGIQVENLTDYVKNYFDNLDVQDEINNKLNEMAESGELQEIIAQYLQLAGILSFNTLNDMKNSEHIIAGSFIKTFGYDYFNDKKGAFYKARNLKNTDIVDNINIIALKNENLVAELIKEEDYIKKSYGEGDHLGLGNETYTSKDSNTSVVLSVRGNRASTNPDIVTGASVFAPHNSKETSQYKGRDSVAFFSANQGRNPYLYIANDNSIVYGSNYVNYPETADISKIKVGMVIDTNHNTPYSGLITEINTVEKRIYIEDSWYSNGIAGIPENGYGYSVGKIVKLWVSNKAISLLKQFSQVEGTGEEMNLKNEITDRKTKIVGYDVVTSGEGKGYAGYIARTGSAQFDQSSVGRLERGFIAENTIEGFETWSENDDDYLICSKDKFGNTQNNRFSITNKGLMTNPIINHVSIQTADQKPNFRYAMWIFDNTEPMTYALPNNSDGSYNYRFYTLISRSGKNVTISDTGFVLQGGKAVTYTAIPQGNQNLWIRVSQT